MKIIDDDGVEHYIESGGGYFLYTIKNENEGDYSLMNMEDEDYLNVI